MIRFLHTSDWQLGMTRRFLDAGVQERYHQARFDCIRHIGRLARERGCRFVAVCGDVFESNQVGRKTIVRALEAMKEIPVPIYLLPGNHDPLNEASVFTNRVFIENKPASVTVVADSRPIPAGDGVELVGAPWRAKRLAANPVAALLDSLEPAAPGMVRVCLAHGAVDALAGMADSAAVIPLAALAGAIRDGKIHFAALGDKHSPARVDADGRVWYSGTPEATAFREPDPGYVNLVEVDADRVEVRQERTGSWSFVEFAEELSPGGEGAARLFESLEAMRDKERCVLRLTLSGAVGLAEFDALESRLGHYRELFASFEVDQRHLHAGVDAADLAGNRFTGFAAETVARLKRVADGDGPDALAARDALLLLLRLGRGDGQ